MHHTGPIAGLAAHGPWVATAGYDNRLILWDGKSRVPLARATHDHLVNACDFSHDGQLLASSSSDYSVRIWSLPDLRLQAVLIGHADDVDMARFSPDDRLIATCALDRIVRVFDRSGACLHELGGHRGNVLSLAWVDNARFVTTSVDGTVREWDAVSGSALRIADLGMRCDSVAIAADGRIFAGDDLGRIAVLAGHDDPVFVAGHSAGIKKLVLASDSSALVTLGYDRALMAWSLEKEGMPCLIARSELPAAIWARSAAICPDGRIAVGTFGGSYAMFDPVSGIWDLSGARAGPAINCITEIEGTHFSIGDAGIVKTEGIAIGGPGSLCNFLVGVGARRFAGGHLGELYDADSGHIFHRHHSPLNCAATFDRDGLAYLAVGTYTGEILLFALDRTVWLVRTLRPYRNAVKGIAANGRTLFSVCANTDIAWHSLANFSEVRREPRAHSRIANACCALAEEGFASVGRDRMLRLWLNQGEFAVATPHPNSVKALAASPCGRWIASGSYAGTVVLFDRARMSFEPMHRLSAAGISSLCWSTSNGGFVASAFNGEVHTVPVPWARQTRLAA